MKSKIIWFFPREIYNNSDKDIGIPLSEIIKKVLPELYIEREKWIKNTDKRIEEGKEKLNFLDHLKDKYK